MKFLISLLVLLPFLFGCSSSSKNFSSHYKGVIIVFGQGGGFTGLYQYNALLENGKLFSKTSKDSLWKMEGKVKPIVVKNIVNQAIAMHIDTIILNDSGNMTYFINWKSSDKNCELKWGNTKSKPSGAVKELYFTLNKLIINR